MKMAWWGIDMKLRLAEMADLPQLKAVYKEIIRNMDENGVPIWDEIYPCEFFSEDIERNRLYVLTEEENIVSAFALCSSASGADCVRWSDEQGKALYIDRFGVNVDYLRRGIGSIALNMAAARAGELGAECLRLFVVDINEPAINLYVKNGFKKAEGVYDEVIDDDLVLHEYGFERMAALV